MTTWIGIDAETDGYIPSCLHSIQCKEEEAISLLCGKYDVMGNSLLMGRDIRRTQRFLGANMGMAKIRSHRVAIALTAIRHSIK